MHNYKNHVPINSSFDIAEICKPLKSLGISFFCYHRIYLDGSEIMFSSEGAWADCYYRSGFSVYQDVQYMLREGLDYIVWPYDSSGSSTLNTVRNTADVFYGLSFLSRNHQKDGYVEAYGVALPRNLDFSPLLNNLELLRYFCPYFTNQASSLIEHCAPYKIFPIADAPVIVSNYCDNFDDALKERFINDLKLNQFKSNRINLTTRELACVDFLLLGKTIPEVAVLLGLSPRTVETHVNNIKNKLGCNTKSELITRLWKLGFLPSNFTGNRIISA